MDSQIVCSWPSIQQLAFRPQLATPRPVRQSPDRSHTKWSPSSTAYSCRHCRGSPLTTNGEPRRQNGTCTGAALNQARRRKKHTYRTHTRREVPTLGLGHRTWRTLQPQSSLFPPRTCTSTGPPCPLTHTGNHRTGWSLVRTSCGCVTHFFLQQARSPTIWQPTTTSMGTPPSLATSSATPPRHPHQPLG